MSNKLIPIRNLKLMLVCNSADKYWIFKQDFYALKSSICKQYGVEDGYDMQVIKKHCHSCYGTGIYQNRFRDEVCYSCGGTGTHHTNYVLLKRWLVNGCLLHQPIYSHADHYPMPNGEKLNPNTIYREYNYKSIITGIIKHEESKYNPTAAYFELCLSHNPDGALNILSFYGRTLQTKALGKWKRLLRTSKNSLQAIQKYFGVKPDFQDEELPF